MICALQASHCAADDYGYVCSIVAVGCAYAYFVVRAVDDDVDNDGDDDAGIHCKIWPMNCLSTLSKWFLPEIFLKKERNFKM